MILFIASSHPPLDFQIYFMVMLIFNKQGETIFLE